MHVQHQAAERGPQIKGQVLVRHAAQDQIHIQLTGDLVDGQILTVQAHPGKKVQLTPGGKYFCLQACNFPYPLFMCIIKDILPVVADHLQVFFLTLLGILSQLPDALTPDLFAVVLPEQPDLLLILCLYWTLSV